MHNDLIGVADDVTTEFQALSAAPRNAAAQRKQLLNEGISLMQRFCAANDLVTPDVNVRAKADWPFGDCAYYRPVKIEICPAECAKIGTAGMSWSYPGYTVDRTPFGVIQHELGHHVDVMLSTRVSRYLGDFSIALRRETGEAPISSYCPNDGEWFAEIFRVFVTNPDLLRILRPATFDRLRSRYQPVVTRSWDQVLANAPPRTQQACVRKVTETIVPARPRASPAQTMALF